MTVQIIPILKDNYTYLIEAEDGTTAILDPGEADPVIGVLENRGLKLDYILNTHHHWDHVNGNPKLQKHFDAKLVVPEKEKDKIKGRIDITLKDEDVFGLGSAKADIIETPGHTMGHICFHFSESNVLFTGDTVFSMGCGRLFEGTAEDMFQSFQKIIALPNETMIYCGHEYSESGSKFCLRNDPQNPALIKRIKDVKALREKNLPTIPISLKAEKETNIFMRAETAEEFRTIRKERDNF
ncbi:MAG: hydroxyacylglutathione hydrolase [Alphaproteobacteria bacterium]|nr:hydroxyacylglutathione hydrolase [Alphaproteobacteria bacterium]